jgi:UPF0716 family protein affecting phage T7 exclusion
MILIGERMGLIALLAAGLIIISCDHGVFAATAFGGRYLFTAHLHTAGGSSSAPFVEAGTLTAAGGAFVLTATFNNAPLAPIISPNVQESGTYKLDSRGFGTMSTVSGTDAFAQNATFYCVADGSYCTIESAVEGHAWQGRMWRDDSPRAATDAATLGGAYIFASDAAQNTFTESGIIEFDGIGKSDLQSTFNSTFPGSRLEPGKIWACGEYSMGTNAAGHLTQWNCRDRQIVDTMAIYCFFNGSRCLLVPDETETALWIAEMQRR